MIARLVSNDFQAESVPAEERLSFLEEIKIKKPTLLQRIKEIIADLVNKLKGYPQAKSVQTDLEYLDKYVERLINSKDIKITDKIAGERLSIKRTQKMSWEKQINALLNKKTNTIKHSDTLVLNNFTNSGNINTLPFAIPIKTITKAQSNTDEFHFLSDATLFNLQTNLNKWAIQVLNKDRNSVIFIYSTQTEKFPVLVSFELNAEFDNDKVNKCTSIHLQKNVETYLNTLPNNVKIFINKKEIGNLSGTPLNLGRLNSTNLFELDDITDNAVSQEKNSDERFSAGTLEQLRYNPEEYTKHILRMYKIPVTEETVSNFAENLKMSQDVKSRRQPPLMICQACGLDKKMTKFYRILSFFGGVGET